MLNKIINISKDLIKIDSNSENKKGLSKISGYIEKYFEGKSVKIETYFSNEVPSLIIKNFGGMDADIILNGHFDTIPAQNKEQLSPYIDGDKLIGRGSYDMKTQIAMLMGIFEKYIDNNGDKKIILMLTGDEEVGGFDGVKYLLNKGYTGKVALIPDSGDKTSIIIGEKGAIHIGIEFFGKSCHSARPWEGDNPSDKLFMFYQELKKNIEDKKNLNSKDHWGNSVSLNILKGGSATNQVPENINTRFDIRLTDNKETKRTLNFINENLKRYDGEINYLLEVPSFSIDKNNEYLKKYISIAEEKLGEKIKLKKEHGASDARLFSEKNIPVIFHKPNGGGVHSTNEYINTSSIMDVFEIYYNFLEK